jgi:hypothetical protein
MVRENAAKIGREIGPTSPRGAAARQFERPELVEKVAHRYRRRRQIGEALEQGGKVGRPVEFELPRADRGKGSVRGSFNSPFRQSDYPRAFRPRWRLSTAFPAQDDPKSISVGATPPCKVD